MTDRKRALSLRAAQDCENAAHPVCKCRCGGAAHGKARVKDVRDLPLDDPHSPSKSCFRCNGTGRIHNPYAPDSPYVCPRCDGAGRYIEKRIARIILPLSDSEP